MHPHLLNLADWTRKDIEETLLLSAAIKSRPGEFAAALRGKTIALLFQKPSTRTRVAFEAGIAQMGGRSLYLAPQDLQLGRGETVSDTARVLSRYVDAIVARVFAQADLVDLAESGSIPVINALSDKYHPCQAIADFLTLTEKKKSLSRLKLAYVGDGNNVTHSLIQCAAKLGVHIAVACPSGYEPDPEVVRHATRDARRARSRVEIVRKPSQAVRGADAVYTDVWTSMGQEAEEQKRRGIFQDYQVSAEIFAIAKRDAIFMHCLPAHRGDEVTSDVIDSPASVVFDQVENRLHTGKAILYRLLCAQRSGVS